MNENNKVAKSLIFTYFNTLPIWDGVSRLNMFMPNYCGTEDNEYTRQLGPIIFNGIVSRVFNPGCEFEYLPVFIGYQGIGKSHLVEVLSMFIKGHLNNIFDLRDRDMEIKRPNKFIIEWEEAFSRALSLAKMEKIERFVTAPSDIFHRSYHSKTDDVKRDFIIIATSNYVCLADYESARFMLPVHFNNQVDISKVKADLPQLYAEALYDFKQDKHFDFDDVALEYLRQSFCKLDY